MLMLGKMIFVPLWCVADRPIAIRRVLLRILTCILPVPFQTFSERGPRRADREPVIRCVSDREPMCLSKGLHVFAAYPTLYTVYVGLWYGLISCPVGLGSALKPHAHVTSAAKLHVSTDFRYVSRDCCGRRARPERESPRWTSSLGICTSARRMHDVGDEGSLPLVRKREEKQPRCCSPSLEFSSSRSAP